MSLIRALNMKPCLYQGLRYPSFGSHSTFSESAFRYGQGRPTFLTSISRDREAQDDDVDLHESIPGTEAGSEAASDYGSLTSVE
jgi:hypothetical protein